MFWLKDKWFVFGTVAQPNCTSFSRLHFGKGVISEKIYQMDKKVYLKCIDNTNSSGGLEQRLVNINRLTVARRGSKQQSSSMPMYLEESEDEKVMSMLEEGGKICREESRPIYDRQCSCGGDRAKYGQQERRDIGRDGALGREEDWKLQFGLLFWEWEKEDLNRKMRTLFLVLWWRVIDLPYVLLKQQDNSGGWGEP